MCPTCDGIVGRCAWHSRSPASAYNPVRDPQRAQCRHCVWRVDPVCKGKRGKFSVTVTVLCVRVRVRLRVRVCVGVFLCVCVRVCKCSLEARSLILIGMKNVRKYLICSILLCAGHRATGYVWGVREREREEGGGAYFHVIKQNAARLGLALALNRRHALEVPCSLPLPCILWLPLSLPPSLSLPCSITFTHNMCAMRFSCVCSFFFISGNNLYFTKVADSLRSFSLPLPPSPYLPPSLACCFDSLTKLKLSSCPSSLAA